MGESATGVSLSSSQNSSLFSVHQINLLSIINESELIHVEQSV